VQVISTVKKKNLRHFNIITSQIIQH